MKYLVVYKSLKNGAYRACDHGKCYAYRMTAIRHMHLHEAQNNCLTFEVMAIPAYMADCKRQISMWLREDEETREEILAMC